MGDSKKNEADDFQVYDGEDPSQEDSANDGSTFKSTGARPDRPTSSSRPSSSSSRRQTTRKPASSPPVFLVQTKTRIRELLTPYLPPPVVQAMHRIDPQLEPLVGPEACVTLVGTLLVAWLVLGVVRMIFQSTSNNSSRRAIADDDDDDDQVLSSSKVAGASAAAGATDNQYDATVLLCGPHNSGKTCLFYQLGLGVTDLLPTVTSIKANVAVVSNNGMLTSSKSNDDKENENISSSNSRMPPRIRYVDWPGHAPLSDPALEKSVWNKPSFTTTLSINDDAAPLLRIVLVLDATQPVAAAAETLYELWSRAAAAAAAQQSQSRKNFVCIFCACHKKDLSKAKNSMRIKIQMRTELQRILSVQKPSWWKTTTNDPGTLLDLNDLPYCKLHFASTSSTSQQQQQQQQQQGPGMNELAIFCQTGQLPSKES
jgi:Signal recognition particle receptor beta subunit